MEEITVYHNNFGIAFYWKKENETIIDKIRKLILGNGILLPTFQRLYFWVFN
jgi:hypothetical protein